MRREESRKGVGKEREGESMMLIISRCTNHMDS